MSKLNSYGYVDRDGNLYTANFTPVTTACSSDVPAYDEPIVYGFWE